MHSSENREDADSGIYREITDFWSFQPNNEIFLVDQSDIVRGSKEYFDAILAARKTYILQK